MGNRLWWVWIAAGCGGIRSAKDAPFEVGSLRAGLWSTATASDEQNQSAILVLSDQKVECTAISGEPIGSALDQLTREGKGLWFILDQTVADGGAVLEWTGTWTADGGALPGSGAWGSRSLGANAFETGVIYEIYSEPSDWLRLDDVGADQVEGEFWTGWWQGRFKAESCGGWEAVDTGYTYGR